MDVNMLRNCVSVPWHIEDVQSRDSTLSDDEALTILDVVVRCHNPEIGVNWDVIDHHIEQYHADAKQRIIDAKL